MRVLAVLTHFPWPQNHGDALRRLMLLQALGSSSQLEVLCIARPETTPSDVEQVSDAVAFSGLEVLQPWHRDLSAPRSRWGRLMRGILTLSPPWLYRQWSPRVSEVLKSRYSDTFDVIVLIGEPAGLFAHKVKAGRIIWDKSNVLTASNIDALSTVSSRIGKLRALTSLPLSYLFERRTIRRVDEIWVTSEEERDRLFRHFGRLKSVILPSMIARRRPSGLLDHGSRVLLWLGTLSYTPNWDGLIRFLEAAEEALRAGGYTVRIVGAGATDAQATMLSALDFVDYWGYAEELDDACRGVALGVVPVWAGAGVKLKTLTLMSLGVPVIATPVALEGIPYDNAAGVAATPEDFMHILSEMTPQGLEDSASRAHAHLLATFSEEHFMNMVRRTLDDGL